MQTENLLVSMHLNSVNNNLEKHRVDKRIQYLKADELNRISNNIRMKKLQEEVIQ